MQEYDRLNELLRDIYFNAIGLFIVIASSRPVNKMLIHYCVAVSSAKKLTSS